MTKTRNFLFPQLLYIWYCINFYFFYFFGYFQVFKVSVLLKFHPGTSLELKMNYAKSDAGIALYWWRRHDVHFWWKIFTSVLRAARKILEI